MRGFTVNPSGSLNYSWRSVEGALEYKIDSPPSTYTGAAAIAEKDGNRDHAANLYLAAALTSAGMSRTLAYEAEAERLAK